MKFYWTKNIPKWFWNSWRGQSSRAFRDFFKSCFGVIINLLSIVGVLLHLILELILAPLADIFKLGYFYKKKK